MIQFYLLGSLIAFLIELVTTIRMWEISTEDLCFMFIIAPLMSWIWVFCFFSWVFHVMGLQYGDGEDGINSQRPYDGFITWRCKR